jgi:hypothetical protein
LPNSGENAVDSESLRLAQKRLNDLKINTLMNDPLKYGLVYAEKAELSFGKFEPGDLFMIQRNTKTKLGGAAGSNLIGSGDEVIVTKILSKDLVERDGYNLARTLKQVSDQIFNTNIFFPNEILSLKDSSYLVKVTFDKNQITPKQMG